MKCGQSPTLHLPGRFGTQDSPKIPNRPLRLQGWYVRATRLRVSHNGFRGPLIRRVGAGRNLWRAARNRRTPIPGRDRTKDPSGEVPPLRGCAGAPSLVIFHVYPNPLAVSRPASLSDRGIVGAEDIAAGAPGTTPGGVCGRSGRPDDPGRAAGCRGDRYAQSQGCSAARGRSRHPTRPGRRFHAMDPRRRRRISLSTSRAWRPVTDGCPRIRPGRLPRSREQGYVPAGVARRAG